MGNGVAYVGGEGNDAIVALGTGDALYGGKGRDVLDGRAGADEMYGGADDDIYIVDNSDDVIIELEGEGDDLVKSSVNHLLSEHVENLELTGSDNLNGTGNGLNNVMRGNKGGITLWVVMVMTKFTVMMVMIGFGVEMVRIKYMVVMMMM